MLSDKKVSDVLLKMEGKPCNAECPLHIVSFIFIVLAVSGIPSFIGGSKSPIDCCLCYPFFNQPELLNDLFFNKVALVVVHGLAVVRRYSAEYIKGFIFSTLIE